MNPGTLTCRHEQYSGIATAQLIPSGSDQTAAWGKFRLGVERALFNVPVGTPYEVDQMEASGVSQRLIS